jgi:hypothetical protein
LAKRVKIAGMVSNAPDPYYVVFIDEAGDPGLKTVHLFIFVPFFAVTAGWSASIFCCLSRTSENPSMSAMSGNPEDICSR